MFLGSLHKNMISCNLLHLLSLNSAKTFPVGKSLPTKYLAKEGIRGKSENFDNYIYLSFDC